MMRAHALLVLLLSLWLCLPALALGAPNDYALQAIVSPPEGGAFTRDTLYRLPVPSTVLENVQAEAGDLRLYDRQGREVPYVLLTKQRPARRRAAAALQIISFQEDAATWTLLLEAPENKAFSDPTKAPDARYPRINTLEIDTPSRNFQKRVIVEGAQDKGDWTALGAESIYDFSSRVELRKTTVAIPRSAFRYYRLRFEELDTEHSPLRGLAMKHHDMSLLVLEKPDPHFRINAVTGVSARQKEAEELDIAWFSEFTQTPSPTPTEKDHITHIDINAALPALSIVFDVADPYYYRRVTVSGGANLEKGELRYLAQGRIYRFLLADAPSAKQTDAERQNKIKLKAGKHAWYRLAVDNEDNPPLDIRRIGFEWVGRQLFFTPKESAAPGEHYTLRFKTVAPNNIAPPPGYDIARFIRQANWDAQPFVDARLGEMETNPDAETPSRIQEYLEQWLLVGVAALIGIVLTVWLVLLLKGKERKNG